MKLRAKTHLQLQNPNLHILSRLQLRCKLERRTRSRNLNRAGCCVPAVSPASCMRRGHSVLSTGGLFRRMDTYVLTAAVFFLGGMASVEGGCCAGRPEKMKSLAVGGSKSKILELVCAKICWSSGLLLGMRHQGRHLIRFLGYPTATQLRGC